MTHGVSSNPRLVQSNIFQPDLHQAPLRLQKSPFHQSSPFHQFEQAAHQAGNTIHPITEKGSFTSIPQKLMNGIVRYSPLLSLAGGGLLLLTAGKPWLTKWPILVNWVQQLEKSRLGTHLISLSFLSGALTDVVGGVNLKQPSMIAAGGLQLIPPVLLSFNNSKSVQTIATQLWMLFCGLWQAGYVKILDGKLLDRTRLDQPANQTKPTEKPFPSASVQTDTQSSGLSSITDMCKTVWEDHVHLVKSLFFPHSNPHSTNPHSNIASQTARASVLLTYLGTIPAIISVGLLKRTPSPIIDAVLTHTRFFALLAANLSLFQVAWQQNSLLGKAPLLGIPLSALGNATATSPALLGLGRIGEALNTGFFSNLALNGLSPSSPKD